MIKRFLYLNGLAILIVVLNHSVAHGYNAMFWWTDRYLPVSVPNFDQIGSPTYYVLRLIEQGLIFGIPIFLFVSGFFIAFATPRNRSTIGWEVVFARIKTLAIPYLLWSIVYLLVNIIQGEKDTVVQTIIAILTGRTTEAFYYIPVLVQLYLLSPFLVHLAKTRWKLLLIISLLFQFCTLVLRYFQILGYQNSATNSVFLLARSWLFPGYIFWFALGILVGFYLPRIKIVLERYRWFLLASLVVAFSIGFFEWEALFYISGKSWINPKETLIDNLYALTFILCFLAFVKINLPLSQPLTDLGSKSYGIYLVHSLILLFTARTVYHVFPKLLAYPIPYLFLLVAMGLGLPLLFMMGVNRSPIRRYYKYLFG